MGLQQNCLSEHCQKKLVVVEYLCQTAEYPESIIRFESASFEIFKWSRVLKYRFGFVGENRELRELICQYNIFSGKTSLSCLELVCQDALIE